MKEILKFSLEHIKREKINYAAAFLIVFITTALTLPVPFLFKKMIDSAIYNKELGYFAIYIGVILAITFLREGGRLITNITMEKSLIRIVTKIKDELTKRFLKHALYPHEKPGYVVSRVYDEPEDFRELFFDAFIVIMKSIMLFLFGFVALMYLSVRLTIILLFFIPIYIYFSTRVRNTLEKYIKDAIEKNAKSREFMTNIAEFPFEYKIFDKKSHLLKKADAEIKAVMSAYYRYSKHAYIYDVIMNILNDVIPITIVLVGVYEIFKGRMTAGGLFAYTSMQSYLLNPIQTLIGLRVKLVQTQTVYKRYKEFYPSNPNYRFEINTKQPEIVKIQHLYVKLQERVILKDVNFEISEGEKVLITGPNGSGKTMLLRAISGFLKDYKGQISYNVHPYQAISAFLDSSPLFKGTLLENITFSKDIYNSKRLTKIMEITNLIDKYEPSYLIDVNGKNLSQGERQKVLLARALYKDALLYLLDEPLQHIPSAEALKIFGDIMSFLGDRSLICVMHKPDEFIDSFDRVLEFENRELVLK